MARIRIGELARRSGCQVETIRYYEREGLLSAAERSEGNYRLYADEQVDRLRFIRHCRNLDMSLDEIRILLRFRDSPKASCIEVNALLDEHIGHVQERITDLQALQRQLIDLRKLCRTARESEHCGILKGLSKVPERRSGRASGHVKCSH